MPVPLTPSGKAITSSCSESSLAALWGLAGTPPTRRMNQDRYGSPKAQSRTMNRGHRGSGWSFMIATVIIVASNGNSEPAWFATNSARPWAGTLRSPSASTRHQTS